MCHGRNSARCLMERAIAYIVQCAYKILVHRGFRLNFQILGCGKTHIQQLNVGYLAITLLSVWFILHNRL